MAGTATTHEASVARSAVATAPGTHAGAFVTMDWVLLLVPALLFGGSFLLMAEGLEALAPGVVTFGRIAAGFLTLACVPAARAPIDRSAWPRIALLGFTWMALPLSLYPLAQQHLESAVAGMINGGTPLLVAMISSVLLGRLPGFRQRVGLLVGLAGIVLVSLPSLGRGGNSVVGVLMVLGAITGYGFSFNLTVPLQQTYGALPVIFRAQAVAVLLTLPGLAIGIGSSDAEIRPMLAVLALGAGGTAIAYVCITALAGRVGSTRSSIVTYVSTPVAIALGVLVRGDSITPIQLVGVALILSGAWSASRAEG